MFNKRSINGVELRRGKILRIKRQEEHSSNTKSEETSQTENDSTGTAGMIGDKIKMIKQYHKLRQRNRGLHAAEESIKEAQKAVSSVTAASTNTHMAMLEKTFESKTEAKEEETDQHFEEYLAARLQATNTGESTAESKATVNVSHDELQKQLFAIPEHLQVEDQSSKEKDKVVWGVGLAEIPLTLEEKLRHIEEIEHAKRAILTKALVSTTAQKIQCMQKLERLSDSLIVKTAFGRRFQENEPRRSSAMTDDIASGKYPKKPKP